MIRRLLITIASAISLPIVSGCTVAPPKPPPLPQPSSFRINGTIDVNLTAQIMAQTGLPATLKATLDATAESEAISASPLRSRHEGHLSFIITDGSGQRSLATVDININGESAGSPTEGLRDALNRFLDAASLISRPVPPLSQPAH